MPPTTLNFPPLDYSLLFPDLINFHMERNPTFPVFVYANETDPDTLTEISFLEFGRAAHRAAHTLRPFRQGPDGEVVMIIANTDTILHHTVVAGLSIAGWVPFPTSPRNSAEAIVHMIKKTRCSRIVTLRHVHQGLIDALSRENEGAKLIVVELPTLHYTFPKLGREVATDPFVAYPPALKRPDLDSPAIYFHSSGSTGLPKPIAHTYRIQIQWFARPATLGHMKCPSPRRFGAMALPAFHCFGNFYQLYLSIAFLVSVAVYSPRTEHDPFARPVIPTSDNMTEYLTRVPCNALLTVPALLELLAESEEAIKILKKLESVLYSGGPLPVKVGEKLRTAGVRLVSVYGGTEFGILVAQILKQDISDDDWMWMRFSDEPKVRWAPQGDGAYELEVLSTDNHYAAVENLPDVKGYATSDIFVKHPTKDLWRVIGRTDDVIVLASGEKTVPAPMEGVIENSPFVQSIVMFGRERNQVGVLIEPSPAHAIDVSDEIAVVEFRNQIWPVIEKANNQSPAFGRIFKDMILIANRERPMMRTPKGNVRRNATLEAYEEEINALYDSFGRSSAAPVVLTDPVAWTSEVLEVWLLTHALAISPDGHVDVHTDLFSQGFDSLSATYLRNQILSALKKSRNTQCNKAGALIPPNIIFENPTIRLLSMRLAGLVHPGGPGEGQDFVEQHKQAINIMIEKYSVGLNGPANGMLPTTDFVEPAVVLLTGSTGSLGSFLLSELLESRVVRRVFAFNRPSSTKSIEERQKSAFKDRGLSIELLESAKLVHVEADAARAKCGLSDARYEEIRNTVTVIIHNAWRLDFNLAISSFEDNIRASRNLVDLGLDSRHKQNLRFLFTSSIGSGQSWDNSKGPFPEDVIVDPSVAVGAGYGESKYATERIILQSGLHATSLRIGQIVGGLGGAWATTDWFPILVKSSLATGVLPECAGIVSWVRQEDVSRAILETAFAEKAPPVTLNLVNPRGALWAEIIVSVRRSIVKRKVLEDDVLPIVPFAEWFALLEKRAEVSGEDLVKIPAIKLLSFFRALARGDEAVRSSGVTTTEAGGIASLSTNKIKKISPTVANMQMIGEDEADAWVEYWISKGVFKIEYIQRAT